MELILAAISAGGMVGVADQYLCLLIVGIAGKLGWIQISPTANFMTSWWFLGIVGAFWILTVAPAYLTTVAPGLMNSVNTVVNFLSGFLVPLSGALIALLSVGAIAGLNPQAQQILETVRLWGIEGSSGGLNWTVAGGGALAASFLTGAKAIAKPGLSATTGTFGHVSAPIYTTAENTASVLGMGLLYFLASVNPWLIVILMILLSMTVAGIMVYAILQLKRVKSGLGEYFRLLQNSPGAGFTVALEFLAWGLGWMIKGCWMRGFSMFGLWVIYGISWWALFGLTTMMPFLTVCFIPASLMIFVWIGLSSAKALLRTFPPVSEVPPTLGQAA